MMNATTFMTSYLTFYMKGSVEFDGNFVRISRPNTILKFIPLGMNKQNFPVEQISSVTTNFRVSLGSLLWGLLFALCGLSALPQSLVGGLLFFAYGGLTIISSLQTVVYLTAAGNDYLIPIVFTERAKADEIERGINELIAGRYADTNVRANAERSTDRIVDAIRSSRGV